MSGLRNVSGASHDAGVTGGDAAVAVGAGVNGDAADGGGEELAVRAGDLPSLQATRRTRADATAKLRRTRLIVGPCFPWIHPRPLDHQPLDHDRLLRERRRGHTKPSTTRADSPLGRLYVGVT
jgi:hypothetical protein